MSPNDSPSDFASMLAAFEAEQAKPPRAPGAGRRQGERPRGRLRRGERLRRPGAQVGGAWWRSPSCATRRANRTVEVGDEIEALVTAIDDDAGTIVLRVRPGQAHAAPRRDPAGATRTASPSRGRCRRVNKGGVEVTISGVRAFCPISQLDARYVEDPATYVGQRLAFRITKFERGPRPRPQRRAVAPRAARGGGEGARRRDPRASSPRARSVSGTVTSLASYGAFVDLGGLEGLLHVSEMGHGRIEHPQEILAVGQEVDVQVLKIEPPKDDKGHERISLSLKALQQDPWEGEVAERFRPATRHRRQGGASAAVRRLRRAGARGSTACCTSPRCAPTARCSTRARWSQAGQELEVTVLSVDTERRRISLTLAPRDRDLEAQGSREDATPGFGALGDFFKKT